MQKKSILVISSIIAIISIGVFAMVFSFSYPNPNYQKGLILPEDETTLSVVMAKAKQLGVNNIMEVVDSNEFSYDEKIEYIKLNYEKESNVIPSLNLRIKELTRELTEGQKPSFTLIETGYSYPCTAPKLEVYLVKGERAFYSISEDKPIYEEQVIMHPCPKFDQYFPVLNYWTEEDFPNFPSCKYQGTHIIVGDSGTERHALDEYFCKTENPSLTNNQILTVVGEAPCAWMSLHQIPHSELLNRHDRTGANALLLKIDDDDINKVLHLKEMFAALENKTGFEPNEYEKNAWVKRINSSEIEQQKIWNWLKDTFDSQYGKRSDDSFTSYFTYKEKFYQITWALC